MNKNYICIHQGYGDLFQNVGLINFYSQKCDKLYVFVLDENRRNVINAIFKNNDKISSVIPTFKTYQEVTHPRSCFLCMTNGSYLNCPRNHKYRCKYIKSKDYDGEIINIGCFKDSIKWENFRNNQLSFAHSFYSYNNIDLNVRFENFILFNDVVEEEQVYTDFVKKYGEKYILIHQDPSRNLLLNYKKVLNKNLPCINLNCISSTFVNYTKVIKNATEIHLIDSSWSVFIYLLSYKFLKNIPIFLNETYLTRNGRDTNIYKNPTFQNWNFY